MISPRFRGEWYVMQGGRSALVNHHYLVPSQSDALDLVMLKGGRRAEGDRNRLDSYAAYSQPLFAPADGRVTRAINDYDDMAIGMTDIEHLVGNHVIIALGKDQYVLMAHLMKGSVLVSEGDQVRRGQPIAACGNSGNTSEPHLHLQVQTAPVFAERGLTTVPIALRDIELNRWGRHRRGTIGNLRRNDRLISLVP
jgi:murein DD-endopeptidase MepM/ murein hydrolase activator NlpD